MSVFRNVDRLNECHETLSCPFFANFLTEFYDFCHAHSNMEVLLAIKRQAYRRVFLVLRLRYGRATTFTVSL